MSEPARSHPAQPALRLYQAVAVVSLLVIGILVVYAISLGPLVGPGVEESFGIATAIMFLAAALLVHLIDRTYRVWPGGRRVHPSPLPRVTDRSVASLLKVVVLLAVAGSVAYVLATLLT